MVQPTFGGNGLTQAQLFDTDKEYITFKLASEQKPKTWVYDIFTKVTEVVSGVTPHGILLGQIRWYAQWRQYALYPEERTVFEKKCLTDITDFIKELNAGQRRK